MLKHHAWLWPAKGTSPIWREILMITNGEELDDESGMRLTSCGQWIFHERLLAQFTSP
jgi:hypothetical protein